ncbi:putative AAA family ATPase [Glonium stellatum]|uniref:Putative AAA family ATPase n=1 Tax=Glonium stellatum TaxID=574774 RepID=A0A8E2FDQ4_9PEZI|nr:putative AAA family ATPase [Glonium stellatum]
MSTASTDPALKSTRLRKFFTAVLDGKRAIKNTGDAKLFLEALCDQQDRSSCVEKLVVASQGLQALKMSLRSNVSSTFINDSSASFLTYISDDSVRQLCGGQLLRDILVAVVDPPTFWNALEKCFDEKTLSSTATHAFACLLHELLLSLPTSVALNVTDTAKKALGARGGLLDSPNDDTRTVAYKIQNVVRSRASGGTVSDSIKPGGRHDNDFEDFREIAIFPTKDEFMAKDLPYYLQGDVVLATKPEDRTATHLDNQFRLLREDMLAELRNDFQIARGKKKGGRASLQLKSLVFERIDCGNTRKPRPASIALRCYQGLPKLPGTTEDQRRKYYADNKTILKHNSFGCLLCANEIVAFATVERNEDLLAENPPIILLQIFGDSAVMKVLIKLKTADQQQLEFVLVDTPFFAYEPILKCLQEKKSLALSNELLDLVEVGQVVKSPFTPERIVAKVKEYEGRNLRNILTLPKDVTLEHSQTESLATSLSQTVSLIQGPPGTGKSFIGAILAKTLHENTNEKILVLCYTNHALDQFLEDILDIGVPDQAMLRLGSKSTLRTKSLGLFEQSGSYRRSAQNWNLMNKYSKKVEELSDQIQQKASAFRNLRISGGALLEYLQFSDTDSDYFYALSTPENDDGMARVGKKGKAINSSYLMDRWLKGLNAGVFQGTVGKEYEKIWSMDKDSRTARHNLWTRDFFKEQAIILQDVISDYAESYEQLSIVKDQKHAEIIEKKRIIGCTTTAAARYAKQLLNARPGIILVEEAGEILESHVLAALSPNTKHLVLIGDHQQLRPKVNNYALTVEKGDGYDLNKSLFERLVLGGYPHTTLAKQHRMRPEISALVKSLMYPNLQDDAKTLNRPHLRGLQSNVVFFNHNHYEVQNNNLADRRDEGSGVSRQNEYEAEMVLKTVRYLAQQGYGADKQVVLTPYLGQLQLLFKYLKADHDPILNDLDSFDLARAGVLSQSSASIPKKSLRISTIDNYQGEESEIVIASLTRSNDNGDIGFMAAPQRLNVLLSRARNGLIIIGNADTFTRSRKGSKVWIPLLQQLTKAGQLYDGLAVKCERHPKKVALLKTKEDFDIECPDGGCSEPCNTMMSCGQHICPQRCHPVSDHAKLQCTHMMQSVCPLNHKNTWECWKKSVPCAKCEAEAQRVAAQRQRDHKLDQQRAAKEREYANKLAEIDQEIAHQRRLQKEHGDQLDRDRVLQQRKKDLASVQATTKKVLETKLPDPGKPAATKDKTSGAGAPTKEESDSSTDDSDEQPEISPAKVEWDYQKKFEGADNIHLDVLMDMIGLESVKQQILDIKTKIDTCIRQGASVKDERFGVALLGNPGTGKTTVARLYAKFLASVGVLPGTVVEETTGSRLASDGVQACKKLIEGVLNAGGGAIFIDEAYQLASGGNYGGTQILDFLLAEVENLTGKIVFILAGYNKQMESFFAHNPGIPSRFPHTFQFQDYEDKELRRILEFQIKKRFQGRMKAEDGLSGLYCRIVARRVGYGRGHEGFGNARAVENAFSRALTRQATRLARERRAGKSPDDLLLVKEDLIGPKPSDALGGNKSWEKLQGLTGMKAVKQSVKALFDSIQYNYDRELEEQPLLQFSLNRVFLGPPGTGKTTVAKLYGQILADIGLLSNGEVVVKNPSDFVGDVLGGSEKLTKGILASTVGKVLVIDEAYGLYGGGGKGSGGHSDIYKTAVIDTIVAEVQSVPGDDRCVLLLGYKDQMENMFQNVNPGLSRRFPFSEAFEFEDFTDDELKEILEMKLEQQAYKATDQAKRVAMEVLKRARNRPNFGNAGEVDILLNSAKGRHQQRRSREKVKDAATLEAVDMDPEFDRGARATTNVRMLFEGTVGCDEIVAQLEGYQKTVANMKARDMDPREQIPFNFLFRGPPGTGKTTTARKMGKIYYDMGFLATAEVLERSATDLVGQYVGQTGPKTQQLLEQALGKVLFIDEAYRLAEGHFAKEAMDEIVDCLTKPAFAQKLVVILAGYDADINRLMSINPGLTSRFPETLTFRSLNPQECLMLFIKLLKKKKHLDAAALEPPSVALQQELLHRFDTLASLPSWANARDVGTLAKAIYGELLRTSDPTSPNPMRLGEIAILTAFDDMITERSKRANHTVSNLPTRPHLPMKTAGPQTPNPPAPSSLGTQTHQAPPKSEEPPPQEPPPQEPPLAEQGPESVSTDQRDPGVSDDVWARLQLDKQAAVAREKEYQDLLAEKAKLEAEQARKQKEEEEFARKKKEEEELEQRRLQEQQAREEELQQRKRREEELARLERERQRREEEKRKEEAIQRKIRSMGVCVQGFQWIKQCSGYRCAGGTHFLSDAQLGL